MFYTITQVLFGIIYGLYLALLAPTSQRQKAHDWLKQQATTPRIQPKARQPLVESVIQPAAGTKIVENLWSVQTTSAVTENQENPTAIAIKKQLRTATVIGLDPKQSAKTYTTKPKQSVAQVQVSEVVPTGLGKMTVAQLRSLCKERKIKWRNAYGNRHLTKAEMQGTAECLIFSAACLEALYLGCSYIYCVWYHQKMIEFNFVKVADAEVLREIDNWLNKIENYLHDFFNGERERVRGTQFGDNIAKVTYIAERSVMEPNAFRGVKDLHNRLQAAAIVELEADCLLVDAIASAPWNVLRNQPESLRGFGTLLIEELVKESIDLGLLGRLKLYPIERALFFYRDIGFTESDDFSEEIELAPFAAKIFLKRQERRRHNSL